MSGVFISYRRSDRPGYAARLTEALERRFGADRVFRDVEDIAPGSDFAAVISQKLNEVDLVLALIGPAWLQTGPDGANRLTNPADFVRLEILSALNTGKPVWPVLVSAARLPEAGELPEELQALLKRQAVVLTDTAWHDDVARLADALKPLMQKRAKRPGRRLAIAGFALIGLAALGMWSASVITSAKPGGRWLAEVSYDWGDRHQETFDLHMDGDTLRGHASYLGTPRLIEEGEHSGSRIRFVTRSESMAGSEVRTLIHRYHGQLEGERLYFRLESTGFFSGSTAVEFIAIRAPDG